MKQRQRGLIVFVLYLSLILIIFTSCRTRKVVAEKDIFEDRTEITEETKVHKEKEVKVEEKTKATETKTDSSKVEEKEKTTITADSIIQNVDGSMLYKGNAVFNVEKSTITYVKKKSVLETLKDLSTQTSDLSDSLASKSEARDIKEVKQKKDTSVKSISFWQPLLILLGILGVIAFVAVKWNWLTAVGRNLFG